MIHHKTKNNMDTFNAAKIVEDYFHNKEPRNILLPEPLEKDKTDAYRWGEECARKVMAEIFAEVEQEQNGFRGDSALLLW